MLAAVTRIVAEMTGYPPELLDPDLDLEADLGVDTVKQAEVFAAVREEYDLERDATLQLRDFPTLNHVTGWVRDKAGLPARTPAPAAVRATGRRSDRSRGHNPSNSSRTGRDRRRRRVATRCWPPSPGSSPR